MIELILTSMSPKQTVDKRVGIVASMVARAGGWMGDTLYSYVVEGGEQKIYVLRECAIRREGGRSSEKKLRQQVFAAFVMCEAIEVKLGANGR